MQTSPWAFLLLFSCAFTQAQTVDSLKINAGGKLIVHSEVKLNSGDMVVGANGTLELVNGKITASGVEIQADGKLTGSGTIVGNLTNSGLLALQNPIGVLSVTGNVVLNASGTLLVGLGGLTPGTFSFIDASGTVTLGGTLALNFLNQLDDSLTNTDSFTLINSPNPLSGAFANVPNAGQLISADSRGEFTVLYSANLLQLVSFIRPAPVVTLLYASGDGITGEASTTKFATFGVPALGGADQAAFAAKLTTDAGPQAALLAGSPVTVAFRQGDKALDAQGPDFASFEDPLSNAAGELAFRAKIKGSGISKANDTGVWTNIGGGLTPVVRVGDDVPGSTGAKVKSILSAGLSETGAIPYVTALSMPGIKAASQSLWVWEAGTPTLLLQQGKPVTFTDQPERTVKSFTTFPSVAGSPGQGRAALDNAVLTRVTFTDGLAAIAEVSPTVKNLLVKAGTSVPVAPAGATLGSFGPPAYNANGDIAFLARLLHGGGNISRSNDRAIFADTALVDSDFVAQTGTTAPDAAPARFASFKDPVYNAARQVAFLATLNRGGSGIWWRDTTDLHVLARSGQQATGAPQGARWSSFSSLALPDGIGPVFVAKLQPGRGGVNARNQTGLWAQDRFGLLRLIVRTGDPILIDPTLPKKKIASLTCLPLVLQTPDHARSYNASGQLIYKATCTDRTQAIFRVDFPGGGSGQF